MLYDFDIELTLLHKEDLGVLTDRLYEASCSDALLWFHGKKVVLSFSREASSLEEAVISAKADIDSAGINCSVTSVSL